ncbi:SDR family NAD(P)-dependent oxidoreductase [Chitinophaga varians]|uniref:SDR family NAD(P)-dependent oxidoreductase n=1 Tax=Chitinophaga varians TaxID=2202339 RepID=UPI00165F2014|nr:SDR family oxidoreductase [Chitinophaga varians]MBC9910595.1 SDR family oxidoreductase [Chitinophaga varians]
MSDLFSLKGKKILVTGASSGIGRQICISLADQGAVLVISGRNEDRLKQTLSVMPGEGHTAQPCDLTDDAALQQMVLSLDSLDGVVFCAGVITYLPAQFTTQAKIADIFNVNFNSQIILVQQLMKKKKLNKKASLFFISSLSSQLGIPATLLYASSKAALNAAVKVLAAELAPQKIRVNAVCPGIVRTPLIDAAKDVMEEDKFNEAEKEYPLGYGAPEDVANTAIFYLSDASRWATGNIMILDGGYTLK